MNIKRKLKKIMFMGYFINCLGLIIIFLALLLPLGILRLFFLMFGTVFIYIGTIVYKKADKKIKTTCEKCGTTLEKIEINNHELLMENNQSIKVNICEKYICPFCGEEKEINSSRVFLDEKQKNEII